MHTRIILAQELTEYSADHLLSSAFVKPEINQKVGELSFNIVRIYNHSDSAVRIKPYLDLPLGWALFSTSFIDTVVQPHDSISLPLRLRIPNQASCTEKHSVIFHAYSKENDLLTSCSFYVKAEPYHDWQIIIPDERLFFSSRVNTTHFAIRLINNGNAKEIIDLRISPDKKLGLISRGNLDYSKGIELECGTDTILEFIATYNALEERIFDLSKIQINASATDKAVSRHILLEKYSDVYSPFFIEPDLPHQVEVGFRTFRGNKKILPFIKARGYESFKNNSAFKYNLTFYKVTSNENIIQNTYYSFLYENKTGKNELRTGIGAFGSQLGRNLYARNCAMVNDMIHVNKNLYIETYAAQSYTTPKSSIALGGFYNDKTLKLAGTISYDIDNSRKVNTGSLRLRSDMIPFFKSHKIGGILSAYSEHHYLTNKYTLAGVSWDLNYSTTIGDRAAIFLSNDYGSPNIPGPQMGLLAFTNLNKIFMNNRKLYFSIIYSYSSRDYYNFNYEGKRQPETNLRDNFAKLQFNNHINSSFTWEIGPSIEYYDSHRPSTVYTGIYSDFRTQKFRLELKSVMARKLLLEIKTGFSRNYFYELYEVRNDKYDLHIIGGVAVADGFNINVNYDYGPTVNSGLYQYPNDALNNSITVMPQFNKTYWDDRINLSLFTILTYKLDLDYGTLGINPTIEAYVTKNWYAGLDGTYSYSQQNTNDIITSSSHYYLEFFIKKRWGQTDLNKWQKDTRRLKVVMFKDDNANGIKDDFEEGIPNVKARIVMADAADPAAKSSFPVDITLLSNDAGAATFNRLPMGTYEISVTPLSDMKEYFYVDRSIEKIELTRTQTYYIPFQKANKITGKLIVKRTKFIKPGDEQVDLGNIKITAYNNQGNSYSSFTTQDGRFVIFVPGDYIYFVRMQNVFGNSFRILQNDIRIPVGKLTDNEVVFEINEISRQVNFKQAAPVAQDTTRPEPLKIKVLHGKFYENPNLAAVEKDAIPVFDTKEIPPEEQVIIPGRYYIIVGEAMEREQSVNLKKIIEENGFNAYLGHDINTDKYYVYTNYYQSQAEAKEELKLLSNRGLKDAQILRFE